MQILFRLAPALIYVAALLAIILSISTVRRTYANGPLLRCIANMRNTQIAGSQGEIETWSMEKPA